MVQKSNVAIVNILITAEVKTISVPDETGPYCMDSSCAAFKSKCKYVMQDHRYMQLYRPSDCIPKVTENTGTLLFWATQG